MVDNVQYAAVLALLGLEIPDETVARILLGLWRRAPEMSDKDMENVIQTWKDARRRGAIAFCIPMDGPEKKPESTGIYL